MDTSSATLFPEPPVIRFTPQEKECSCGTRLSVQKTRCKKVFKMTGPLIAHETIREWPACKKVFDSQTLLQLVPARSNVSYEVMVFVGRAIYQRHRTTEEVRAKLAVRNVFLSLSEINYLGRKFILYLARAHRKAIPRIRETMSMAGGYMLHLDATHAGDGYGFPFDRPLLSFAERLIDLDHQLPRLLDLSKNDDFNNIQYPYKLYWTAFEVTEDPAVRTLVDELQWRSRMFDSLRKAMRIALPGDSNGLNDDGTAQAMSGIQEAVMQFRSRIEQDPLLVSDPLCLKMAKQIDKYRDKLFFRCN